MQGSQPNSKKGSPDGSANAYLKTEPTD